MLFSSLAAFGQNGTDVLSWSSVAVEYEPDKVWNFAAEGNLRLKTNISELDEYFGELTVSRKFFKDFKLGLGLRYIWENDNTGNIQGTRQNFRYHIDASFRIEPGDFTTKFRIRYQDKNELGDDDEHVKRLRFKTALGYNFSNWKLDPEISGEIFGRISGDDTDYSDRYRITIGTDYKIKKAGKIDIYYGIQSDFDAADRETYHILGLKYAYTFEGK